MTDRRQIYLDCDGVLADFDAGARRVLGMSSHAYRHAHGNAQFWKVLALEPDYFGTLDLMPDALQLYAAVEHLNPIILTGMPVGLWADPQKRRWAARHFPDVPVITTRAALKRDHCQPGDVLVDDRDQYRDLWEAAGGLFVLHRSARGSIAALARLGFDVRTPAA